jgi:hypothetical protein
LSEDNLGDSLDISGFIRVERKEVAPKKTFNRAPQVVKKIISGHPYWYKRVYYKENGKVKHHDKYIGKRKPRSSA